MSKCKDLALSLIDELDLKVPDEELDLLLKNFEGELKKRNIMSRADYKEAMDIAFNKTQDMRLAARQMKREVMIRKIKRAEILSRIDNYKGPLSDAYSALLVGESKLDVGSRDSVAAETLGLEQDFLGTLLRRVVKDGDHLESVIKKGDLDEQIYAYAYMSKEQRAIAVRDGIISREAASLHKAIYDHSNAIRERKNLAGAYIGEREDFVITQMHDPILISKVSFEEYKADLESLLDLDESFKTLNTPQEIEAYKLDLYQRFSTGKHYLVDEAADEVAPRASSANLAKKMSQARKLHFKDGASAFAYAQKYTRGNLWDKLAVQSQYDARSIAMMERFGPNPKAMHDSIIKILEQRAVAKGETIKTKFLDGRFELSNGGLNVPGNASLAQIGDGLRAIENMSKLGGAVVAAFSDVVFKGATLNRRTNLGFFGSYSQAFRGLIDGVPAKDRKHVNRMTQVYTEGVLGRVHTRAGSFEAMPGRIAKMQETFFRWNFLQGWTMAHKEGVADAVTFDLARYKTTSFDRLPEKTRRNLELYNITADEWSLMKDLDTLVPETGRNHITAPAIRELSDAVIDPVISRMRGTTDVTASMRANFRNRLSTKFQTLISDIADEAVITPGQRERSILTLNTQRGTYAGEFFRFVAQFKTFPVTVITKQLAPAFYAAGGGENKLKGFAALVPLIMATTVFGYLTGAAKDVLRGKQPKDPKDKRTWADAFVRGGGAGIYGDFLFGEYSRYGRSLQETALGPAIGTASDFLSIVHKSAMRGIEGEGLPVKDYVRFVKSVTPFQNLFWTEMAANYMLFNGFMEMADPGYMSRTQRKLKKDYDQEFWLPPAAAF